MAHHLAKPGSLPPVADASTVMAPIPHPSLSLGLFPRDFATLSRHLLLHHSVLSSALAKWDAACGGLRKRLSLRLPLLGFSFATGTCWAGILRAGRPV